MRITIARLRIWIVVVAVLLIAALAGFLAIARYRAHRLISDLPGKLGVTIARTSDSYTLSQTGKNGKTAFTIHASRAVQFTNNNGATLHDVVITLYGAQGDRNDRISGSEFNYDQKTGVVTAHGLVQIDLQAAESPSSAGKDAAGNSGSGAALPAQTAIHVKTSGLVFNQKTQMAATPEYVEFMTPKAAGHSTGATYDVQKGLLILDSAVELTSDHDGQPVLVHAAHAEFLRPSMQAFLLNPVTDYQTEHTSSDRAVVYFRKDGSAEHVDADGNVHLKTEDDQEMTASKAKIMLDQRGQPQRAEASGGLNFISLSDQRQIHGSAIEGTLSFGPGGELSHAQGRNAVSLVEQQRGLNDDPQGSATRELRASQVDIGFVPGTDKNGKSLAVADKILAVGGATAVLHTIRTKGASQNTTIKGDRLLATLQNGRAITGLHGDGHTSLLDLAPTGASNLSSSDTLQVGFLPPNGAGLPVSHASPKMAAQSSTATGGSLEAAQIQSVVQEGNVVIVQTPAQASTSNGHPNAPTHATAHHADYTAATQLLRLQGSPRINDGVTDLTADSIEYHRDTAIANAAGNIKATYLQGPEASAPEKGHSEANASGGTQTVTAAVPAGVGGAGPTHIIAENAILDQARGHAIFQGKARLWQGANSVTAPVIELVRNPESLKAYAEPSNPGMVTTVIENASRNENGPQTQRQADVFRVHSRELLYSDLKRVATFTGAVVAEDTSGVIHSDLVDVFLLPVTGAAKTPASTQTAQTSSQGKAQSTGQSRVDRLVATGHVVLQQSGRRGTGEKLAYTAQDGKFVLTGTSVTPPHLYDQVHGNVSGDALIFNSQDDSVSVTGGQSKAVTDTRTAK